MFTTQTPLVVLVSFLLVAFVSPAAAQPRKRSLQTKGEIVAVKAPFLRMKNVSGKNWVIKVEALPPNIVYRGPADAGYLKPGMLVRFSTQLDRAGRATAPLSEVFVFSPRPGYHIGTFPEADGNMLVAGKVITLKEGKMRVLAGRRVTAELAPDVSVMLDLTNFTLARPGDKIEVKGYFYEGGKGIAQHLRITSSTMFSEEGPKLFPEEGPKESGAEQDGQNQDSAPEDTKRLQPNREKTAPQG